MVSSLFEKCFTCQLIIYLNKWIDIEYVLQFTASSRVLLACKSKAYILEISFWHDCYSRDWLVSEHFTELFSRSALLAKPDFAVFETRFKCSLQCIDNKAVQLISIIRDHVVASSSCISSILDHFLITSIANTKSVGTYIIITFASLFDNISWIINLSICQKKDTFLNTFLWYWFLLIAWEEIIKPHVIFIKTIYSHCLGHENWSLDLSASHLSFKLRYSLHCFFCILLIIFYNALPVYFHCVPIWTKAYNWEMGSYR